MSIIKKRENFFKDFFFRAPLYKLYSIEKKDKGKIVIIDSKPLIELMFWLNDVYSKWNYDKKFDEKNKDINVLYDNDVEKIKEWFFKCLKELIINYLEELNKKIILHISTSSRVVLTLPASALRSSETASVAQTRQNMTKRAGSKPTSTSSRVVLTLPTSALRPSEIIIKILLVFLVLNYN